MDKEIKLSPRKREVYHLMLKGLSNEAIGAELGLSYETIKQYVSMVHRAFGVKTKLQLMAMRIAELERELTQRV